MTNKKTNNNNGFGCPAFTFAVYIANKPNMAEYQEISTVQPLVNGEINSINQACGNGWRKVFNVYAKVLFALDKNKFTFQQATESWQDYRDKNLLQISSQTALLFSPPQLNSSSNKLHIICGKTHAESLINSGEINCHLTWLDDDFAIDKKNKVIVCPYFDYRQLSNIKIIRLAEVLNHFY